MHGMEVHAAVPIQLSVRWVLFYNDVDAMCVTREQLFYDDLYQLDIDSLPASSSVWRGCSPGCLHSR